MSLSVFVSDRRHPGAQVTDCFIYVIPPVSLSIHFQRCAGSRGKSFNLECLLVGCVRGGGGGGRGHLARSGMVWKISLKFLFALDSFHQLLSGPSVIQMILIMKTKCSCLTLSGFFLCGGQYFFFNWILQSSEMTYTLVYQINSPHFDIFVYPTRQ